MNPHHATVEDESDAEDIKRPKVEAAQSIKRSKGKGKSVNAPSVEPVTKSKSTEPRSPTSSATPEIISEAISSSQPSKKRKARSKAQKIPRYDAKEPSIYELVAGMVWKNADGSKIEVPHRRKAFTSAIDHYFKHKHTKMPSNKDDDRVHWHDISEEDEENLPSSELLTAIHQFVSHFFGGDPEYLGFMDETALIAMGILLEETMRVELGDTGFLALYEPDDYEENSDDCGYGHAISDTSYDDNDGFDSDDNGGAEDSDENENAILSSDEEEQIHYAESTGDEERHGRTSYREEPSVATDMTNPEAKDDSTTAGDTGDIELPDVDWEGNVETNQRPSYGDRMIEDHGEDLQDSSESSEASVEEDDSDDDESDSQEDGSEIEIQGEGEIEDGEETEEDSEMETLEDGNGKRSEAEKGSGEAGGDKDEEEEYLFRT